VSRPSPLPALVAVAALAGVPAASAAPRAAADGPGLTVATFNINYGNADLDDIVRVIETADADIVLVQESTPAAERRLRRALGRRYPHMAFRDPDGHDRASGFAWLSRVPLRDAVFVPARDGLFGTWYATAEVGGRALRLVNVHLAPIRASSGDRPAAWLRAVAAMEKVHAREIARVFERVDATLPTVVAGDFNSASAQIAPSFARDHGLVDSYAAAVGDADAHRTWHWQVRGQDVGFRIDYLFHSPTLETTTSRIIESRGSDHHLVVSRLRWTAGTR